VSVVDDYFAGLDPAQRAAFEHIRHVVTEMVPEAEDGTSYGMAALTYRKKPLLGFLAARNHLSIFPFSPEVIDAVRDRLEGFALSRGTVRFTSDMPVPDDVVREIVSRRMKEIAPPSPGA
jgi:uncharacterized protein YdhG (YjbR/CyaY superfamily)